MTVQQHHVDRISYIGREGERGGREERKDVVMGVLVLDVGG